MQGFTRIGKGDVDLEAGGTLYPGLSYGDNELRWGFIRKVYGILAAQIALTAIVSAVTVFYAPINDTLQGSPGIALGVGFLPLVCNMPFFPFSASFSSALVFRFLVKKHSKFDLETFKKSSDERIWLHLLLGTFLTVGIVCANTKGKIVLEALIITSAVLVSLTGYTFWAAKKGKDFSFLGPVLFAGLLVLLLVGFIQIFFPLGSTSVAIYSGLGALIFAAYLVYDTDNLIKRFTYDEYIWASVILYLDILNLFLYILQLLRSSDG
ncbi:hypothetical protein ACLOJK_018662 [Asimina triloba]